MIGFPGGDNFDNRLSYFDTDDWCDRLIGRQKEL